MKHDDTLDSSRWSSFLWRLDVPLSVHPQPAPQEPAATTEAPDIEARAAEPAPPKAPPKNEAPKPAPEDCSPWVEEVWAMPRNAARREALKALSRRLTEGVRSGRQYTLRPRATVRLARLIVWAWPELSEAERDEIYGGVYFNVSDHPEVEALLVECALGGARKMMWRVAHPLDDEDLHKKFPALGRALVRVIDEATTWEARGVALEWLARGVWPESVACLRRALRWNHLECRSLALQELLNWTGGLRPEDVAWLLDDAVVHPIDRPHLYEHAPLYRYMDALTEAVTACPPPDVHLPLERILRGDCESIDGEREFLGEEWALHMLATLRPERALVHIDRRVRASASHVRAYVFDAVKALDDARARPRLLALVQDACPAIAARARDAWSRRFTSPCPVDAFAGVAMDLLDAPPSPSFEARLLVLRNPDDDARGRMVRALYEAPPTRETLALLLFGLRTFDDRHSIEGLPDSSEALLDALVARHGDLALDAVLSDLECGAVGSRWVDVLAWRALKGGLDAPRRDRFAQVVERLLKEDLDEPGYAILRALQYVRPTDGTVEVLKDLAQGPRVEELWSILRDALVVRGPDPSLDAWLIERFAEARAEGAWWRVSLFSAVALKRGVEALAPVIDDLLWNLDLPEANEALEFAACSWRERLTTERALAALEDPAHVRFRRCAWVTHKDPDVAARATALLRRALESDAQGGQSATVALERLLGVRVIAPDAPEVDAVIARVPPVCQASLLDTCVTLRYGLNEARPGQIEVLRPLLRALLVHPDPGVAASAYQTYDLYFSQNPPEGWLAALVPEVRDATVRARLREELEEESEAETYWVDRDEEDW